MLCKLCATLNNRTGTTRSKPQLLGLLESMTDAFLYIYCILYIVFSLFYVSLLSSDHLSFFHLLFPPSPSAMGRR